MAINIVNPDVERRLRAFAEARGLKLTEAVDVALRAAESTLPVRASQEARRAALMRMRQAFKATGHDTGKVADKAFYDWLSDDEGQS
jgi:hypothetical protein